MKKINAVFKNENYVKIKFKITKTQHLLLKAKINGVTGNFILDTGASNTCVDRVNIIFFELKASLSKTKATGAGANGITTQIAKKNVLNIGKWTDSVFNIVILDLSHINEALVQHKVKPIHGIIGADVLLNGKGIIDYFNNYLYLIKD